ncbi:tetratricopeptide repeat protein [Algoriphagus sp. D3-2-R+10]|uniref:tetratricopeptide repeat protein n=1 Tax=Algoriphagus aurantiacus TaxID=3103948 RepID=UPI002B36A13B|nr:tetratricopeptide repeat protein [Algoriphagus sp. D3-2-R+10]MEB2775992.1 tetratricopeptide repeat protein [Algoriphagus sp. D3-2-R+10]
MNRELLNSNFFPKDLMLKLFSDISDSDVETKISLINDHIDEVGDSYDEDVLKIQQHNLIAFCYWMAEQYPQAIKHYEKVMEILKPEDSPQIYFLALNLLIRGNRLLSHYEEAEKWITLAFDDTDILNAFENLINLNDYADLISETGQGFKKNYIPLIQSIINELGFPEKLEDPVTTIRSMNKTQKFWARKLGEIEIGSVRPDLSVTIKGYENYIESCEIDWYRNYAKNAVERIKQKQNDSLGLS